MIKAQAPLAELTDYPTELKSMTGGRGRYSLDLSHYEAVPPAVQKQLGAAWKPHVERSEAAGAGRSERLLRYT